MSHVCECVDPGYYWEPPGSIGLWVRVPTYPHATRSTKLHERMLDFLIIPI